MSNRKYDEGRRWQRSEGGGDPARRQGPVNWEHGEAGNFDLRSEGGDPGRDWGRGNSNRGYSAYNRGQDYESSWDHGRGYPGDQRTRGDYSWESDFTNRYDRGSAREWEDIERAKNRAQEDWWHVPGPYQGIGPRGYRRPDQRISEEVCERLTQHGRIHPGEIEVKVENGEVTLKGTVNSRFEKRIAEEVAASVSGVQDVQNNLRVKG